MFDLSTNQLMRLVDIRDGKSAPEDMLGVGLQAAGYLRQGDWGLTLKAYDALDDASVNSPLYFVASVDEEHTGTELFDSLDDAMVMAVEYSGDVLLVGVWEVYSDHLLYIVYQGDVWDRLEKHKRKRRIPRKTPIA